MTFKLSNLASQCLSAIILTYNEEANIQRTLSSIQWISDILIIDSGSSDRTLGIVQQFDNTRIIYRKFDSFANQCNFGLKQLSSEWVLSLDADYVLTSYLSQEIIDVLTGTHDLDSLIKAYSIDFYYCINGKPIRSGLLPARTCLYKRDCAEYIDIGHGHKVIISGRTGRLHNRIYHDDRKTFGKWLESQQRYQKIEAEMLSSQHARDLPMQDYIRKHTFLAPFLAFFLCLVFKKGILDGKAGIIYAFQRLIAESLLYMYMHGYEE